MALVLSGAQNEHKKHANNINRNLIGNQMAHRNKSINGF